MKTIFLGVGLLALTTLAIAADRIGPVSPIVEPDIREEIQKVLKEKERSGEIARLQKEAAERVKRSAEEPRPVAGIPRTSSPRTYYYDPTYTQPTAVYDQNGRLVAAAGTTVNPLNYVSLSTKMVFFDGRDPLQVTKVYSLISKYPDGYKLVLVGGRPFDLMRERKVRVYFDQGGVLVRKFGIRQVPALVAQDGYRVRIDEMAVAP